MPRAVAKRIALVQAVVVNTLLPKIVLAHASYSYEFYRKPRCAGGLLEHLTARPHSHLSCLAAPCLFFTMFIYRNKKKKSLLILLLLKFFQTVIKLSAACCCYSPATPMGDLCAILLLLFECFTLSVSVCTYFVFFCVKFECVGDGRGGREKERRDKAKQKACYFFLFFKRNKCSTNSNHQLPFVIN